MKKNALVSAGYHARSTPNSLPAVIERDDRETVRSMLGGLRRFVSGLFAQSAIGPSPELECTMEQAEAAIDRIDQASSERQVRLKREFEQIRKDRDVGMAVAILDQDPVRQAEKVVETVRWAGDERRRAAAETLGAPTCRSEQTTKAIESVPAGRAIPEVPRSRDRSG